MPRRRGRAAGHGRPPRPGPRRAAARTPTRRRRPPPPLGEDGELLGGAQGLRRGRTRCLEHVDEQGAARRALLGALGRRSGHRQDRALHGSQHRSARRVTGGGQAASEIGPVGVLGPLGEHPGEAPQQSAQITPEFPRPPMSTRGRWPCTPPPSLATPPWRAMTSAREAGAGRGARAP